MMLGLKKGLSKEFHMLEKTDMDMFKSKDKSKKVPKEQTSGSS
jgi:hypothetical protein